MNITEKNKPPILYVSNVSNHSSSDDNKSVSSVGSYASVFSARPQASPTKRKTQVIDTSLMGNLLQVSTIKKRQYTQVKRYNMLRNVPPFAGYAKQIFKFFAQKATVEEYSPGALVPNFKSQKHCDFIYVVKGCLDIYLKSQVSKIPLETEEDNISNHLTFRETHRSLLKFLTRP